MYSCCWRLCYRFLYQAYSYRGTRYHLFYSTNPSWAWANNFSWSELWGGESNQSLFLIVWFFPFFYLQNFYANKEFQEKYCYVCPDILREFTKYDADISKWVKTYQGINNITEKPFTVDVGYERFLGPEIFFHPEVLFIIYLIDGNYFSLRLNERNIICQL